MKILHTADWHLGRSLYGRKRYEEFKEFLDWLIQTIDDEEVDTLLVAGDVFDTTMPSNRAQKLYYNFIWKVGESCCRHVVVIGGNHDSPSFLNAPKKLLQKLNIHVVGSMTDPLEDEVIILHADNKPEAIICAIPYLRDKDIRKVEPGDTIDNKNAKIKSGLKKHYADVCAIAELKIVELKKAGHEEVPVIAMGHLTAGAYEKYQGDGVQELYIGGTLSVGVEAFPSSINYLALGHLHKHHAVNQVEHIRYSGSPIPIGYGEADHQKKVVLVEFNGTIPNIKEFSVPRFQELVRIEGSFDNIHTKLERLKKEGSAAWIEIEYTGGDIISNLQEMISEIVADSDMEILTVKNPRVMDWVMSKVKMDETLDDLNVEDVFTRFMNDCEVPDEGREELTLSYNEIVKSINEGDINAG